MPTPRSSTAPTATVAVPMLLAGSGSVVALDALAATVTDCPSATSASTPTITVKVVVAPAARLDAMQEIVPIAPIAGGVQVQPVGRVRPWKVVPLGRTMAAVGPTASLGPPLWTVAVNTDGSPAVNGPVGGVTTTARSANALTAALALAVLLDVSGSGIDPVATVVALNTVPSGVPGSTARTSGKETVVPAATFALVQEIVPLGPAVGAAQDQLAGAVSFWTVVCAGMDMLSVVAPASLGPLSVNTAV